MSSATVQIEFYDPADDEHDRIFCWRCTELRRAGYSLKSALLLAVNTDVGSAPRDRSPRPRLPARDSAADPRLNTAKRRGRLRTDLPRSVLSQPVFEQIWLRRFLGMSADDLHGILNELLSGPDRRKSPRCRRDREPDPRHGPCRTPHGCGPEARAPLERGQAASASVEVLPTSPGPPTGYLSASAAGAYRPKEQESPSIGRLEGDPRSGSAGGGEEPCRPRPPA